MRAASLNPVRIVADLYRQRRIIAQLTKRDVLLKYRGAYLGVAWAFLYPLLLLLVFTYVFGHVFAPRWQEAGRGVPFALNLYCGLIVFGLFSEVASRAPSLIRGYPSYVKKILFPLETLPVALAATALIHAAANLLILLAGLALIGKLNWTVLLAPVALLPAVLLVLGIGWFLAAWGVFIRDLVNIMPILVQVVMFLSPLFYPVSAVPAPLKGFYLYNPLATAIEDLRRVALAGELPDWTRWGVGLAIALVACLLGYASFRHGREEFADVM